MRATVDRGVQEYGDDVDDSDLADISLIIADGEQNEDVVIKVSDEGLLIYLFFIFIFYLFYFFFLFILFFFIIILFIYYYYYVLRWWN